MPFPSGYHPTPRGAPLAKAVADARWVVCHGEVTLRAVHVRIVDGVAGGLDYAVLHDAAAAAIEARAELADGAELIGQVALDTYDPEHGHPGTVNDRDRADLERGREHAWTAHLAGVAILEWLDAATVSDPRRVPRGRSESTSGAGPVAG